MYSTPKNSNISLHHAQRPHITHNETTHAQRTNTCTTAGNTHTTNHSTHTTQYNAPASPAPAHNACTAPQRLHHARPIHAYAIQRITAHNEPQHAQRDNAIQRLYCSPSSHQCRPMPYDCSCPSSLATLSGPSNL